MSLAPAADSIESPASSDGEDGAVQANSSDQWVTRCICVNNSQVEGFMIECERCQVWQHGDCVRVDKGKVPDEYFCELCRPELHDARGLWTGGVRTQPTPKVTVNRGNASRKKKTKSRKQSAQGSNLAGITGNDTGEGSNDNAMIDVRGVPASSEALTPGAAQPESTSNSVDDDQKNLSREERKIVKIMQTIQMMEERDKKRRRSGGSGITPDQQPLPNKGPCADEQTSKRRKSRPNSSSKPAGLNVPALTVGGYDVEQLKVSPAVLRNLFPLSPMYLGAKIFLLQQVALAETSSNGLTSLPGTPVAHQSLLRDRLSQHRASLPGFTEDSNKNSREERRTCRSPSPGLRSGPFNMSSNSSPFSSQPISPVTQFNAVESRKEVPNRSVASSIDEPSSESKAPIDPMTDEIVAAESVHSSADSSRAKPVLSTIPRLSIIPKVSVNQIRPSEIVNALPPAPPPPAVPKTIIFNPVTISPIPAAGSVTPLSSLSELMQTYMNAPPTEFAPLGNLDLTRFNPNPSGMTLPSSSVALVPPNVPQFPLPSNRYLASTSFYRRSMHPPSSSYPSNDHASHPS